MTAMENQGAYEDGSDSREKHVQAFPQQVQPLKKASQWCFWQQQQQQQHCSFEMSDGQWGCGGRLSSTAAVAHAGPGRTIAFGSESGMCGKGVASAAAAATSGGSRSASTDRSSHAGCHSGKRSIGACITSTSSGFLVAGQRCQQQQQGLKHQQFNAQLDVPDLAERIPHLSGRICGISLSKKVSPAVTGLMQPRCSQVNYSHSPRPASKVSNIGTDAGKQSGIGRGQ
jgi:hypothetical protein